MFTLHVGEYRAADELNKKLKDVSVFIPASSQEKGVDLMLCSVSQKPRKTLTVQVKHSRTYLRKNGRYDLFFNSFEVCEIADWYILCGIYAGADKDSSSNDSPSALVWKDVFLALKSSEMKKFMDGLCQRKDPSRKEKFFGFQFDVSDKGEINIDLTRGALEDTPFSKYLLENRIDEIAKALGTTPRKSCKSRK